MIKLRANLYDHFIDTYYEFLIQKGFDEESFFTLVEKASEANSDYAIEESAKTDFIKTVFIKPFSKEALQKYPLLKDYYQFVLDKKRTNPLPDSSENKTLEEIFAYDTFMDKITLKKKLRVYIIEASGVEVCPYCNRQYIDVFDKANDEAKAIAQLDHYYPKVEYPLYALSLYNLIPSCASCNQGKSTNYQDVIYPFSETADIENQDAYFRIKPADLDKLMGKKLPEIEYAFDYDDEKKQHADFFHHENMYQNHQRFAQRLLRAQKLDNKAYLEGMNKVLEDSKIRLSEGELKELLYGFNGSDEELLQKPLSKLARDIIGFSKKS